MIFSLVASGEERFERVHRIKSRIRIVFPDELSFATFAPTLSLFHNVPGFGWVFSDLFHD